MIANMPENSPPAVESAGMMQRVNPAEDRALVRDAERYRALEAAVASSRVWLYENGFRLFGDDFVLDLESLSDRLITEQRNRGISA